jgi:predicted MFS family arabinose efflux permease
VIEMVGKEDLMNAVALNSGMFNAARLMGPAVGGLVIATAGVKGAFLLNGISFLPVIAGLMMMNPAALYATSKQAARPLDPLAELREGLSYAFRTPAVLLIVILVAVIGMFGFNFTVMLPLVDRFVLGRGAAELGFLTAAVGLGALSAALLLASRKAATKFTLFAGAAAFAALLGALALSHWFYLTLPILLFLGMASTAFSATANTSLQLATPDHLRGRVMALYMLLFAGSTPIGAFFTGFMAEHLGVAATIAIEGGLCGLGLAAGLLYYLSHRRQVVATADAGVAAAGGAS